MNTPRPDDEDDEDEGLDAPPWQTILPGLDISKVETVTQRISIYRMRVGRNNLTLSLFRQMMPETLVDEEKVELRGEPWFFVNHDPGPTKMPDHRQFLARFGKQLRRCPFRIRHIEGHPSDQGRAFEEDWPPHLQGMRLRHEGLILCALIDRAIQGDAVLPEAFDRSNRMLAFPERSPFAAFCHEADEDLAWGLAGAIDPGADIEIPPSSTTPLVSVREQKRHTAWSTSDPVKTDPPVKPDPVKTDPPVMPPATKIRFPSAAERQQDCREMLRRYLAARGFEAGHPPEHWESLIEQNAESARDYIARWNALMDDLLFVEQLFI